MKKIFAAIFIFLCFSISVFAIDKIDEFWNLCDTNNYEEIEAYLTDWEKSNKKDPELYLAYSTYYFERSTQVSLEFTDEFAKKSEEYLNKGISYNPKRLDLQFKRVSFYSLKHDYKKEYDLLINLLSLDKKYKSKWLWKKNIPLNQTDIDFESEMLDFIYFMMMKAKTEETLIYVKELSLEFLKYYPLNALAYNYAADACLYLGDFIQSKEYFKAAYEIDNSNIDLLLKLGYICVQLSQLNEAKYYYELLSQCSDEEYKRIALNNINEINLILECSNDMITVEGYESDGQACNFKIGKYEVTQELYETIMGTNPSYYHDKPIPGENQNRRPVEFVSWYDAVYFCNVLTSLIMGPDECCYTITNIVCKTDDDEAQKEKFIKENPTYVTFIKSADVTINHDKRGFRLPTRDEWYFASKGGIKSQNYKYSGSNDISKVGWYFDNSNRSTHEVGLLNPNELGLYDMTGNVKEFCEDLAFYTNTKNEVFPRRLQCGGNFFSKEEDSEISLYDEGLEAPGNGGCGFRLVQSLVP